MSLLLHGDCLEQMATVDDNSVDFIFCDLPYGQTSCKWDIIIPWEPFWKEIMRVKKLHTPVFFTTTTKFGVQLINSSPKKMPFRYDLIWVKSSPAGFLSARKMPMRKHEMIYVFYEKLPFYDLSSHKHKFIKSTPMGHTPDIYGRLWNKKGEPYTKDKIQNKYTPHLPYSVIDNTEPEPEPEPESVVKEETSKHDTLYGKVEIENPPERKAGESRYNPPLPTSVVKEDVYNSNERFKNGKLYKNPRHLQKGDDPIYDPPLPTSVVKEDVYGFDNRTDDRPSNVRTNAYDPPLPTTMLEIKSTKGKHPTEKPVALIEWLLKYYSKEGDTVLDPTMGSGTTGVACKNMNRNFIGIEKDLEIYHIAVDRIED